MKDNEKEKKPSIFERLKQGLSKTRETLLNKVFVSHEKIDDAFYEELEEAMILSDMGMTTSEHLIEELKQSVKNEKLKSPDEAREALIKIMTDYMRPETGFLIGEKKAVVLIVGVNGVGKTTSIGKLAAHYRVQNKKVILAAADTFRAAAAEQLSIWADRAGVLMVKHGEGADPAAVLFDTIKSYNARECDILICDTAGRLHNKKNLMDELNKMRRIISREMPDTPVESLLVLDATTGQNALIQAKVFAESAGLTGIILTKLDGTAKGGVVVAVKNELNLPVRFIGIGEGIEDLREFDPEAFSRAILNG
ncbi:MAG: signal recognition particle-docking protein FtsY [Clostridia bacterium]